MSKTRRKTLIYGLTGAVSERADKKLWHGRLRAMQRDALAGASAEALEDHLPVSENEAGSVWAMAKDGKIWRPLAKLRRNAEWRAERKGRTPRERKALAARFLNRWISR